MIKVLDLDYQGIDSTIASFLVTSDEGPILIETGPHSCFPVLKQKVEEQGFALEDIKNVFPTHIHLDHAGAAWAMARQGAKIYVHPAGAPHMIDPSKLLNSAKRIYQDQMETLWGDLQPIDRAQVVEVQDRDAITIGNISLKAVYTPGHAIHHIAWQLDNQVFCGDIAGVKIKDGPVMPPCPPPDVNLEDWITSIEKVEALNPEILFLTHFGKLEYQASHFAELTSCLIRWGGWIKHQWQSGMTVEETTPSFESYVNQELMDSGLVHEAIHRYQTANPAWMSVAGLFRYWDKKTAS